MVFPAGDAEDILISADASALALTYGSDLTFNRFLGTSGGATLTIGSGGITNSSALSIEHSAATALGANSTFTAGTAGMSLTSSLDVKTFSLTVGPSTGTLLLGGGTSFAVSSLATFGRIAGSGSIMLSGALTLDFTTAIGVGTWDFINQTPGGTLTSVTLANSYSGALTESTPGNWVGNYGGLDWSYTASTGVLAAVPEPKTWLMVALGLTLVVVFRRRQKA